MFLLSTWQDKLKMCIISISWPRLDLAQAILCHNMRDRSLRDRVSKIIQCSNIVKVKIVCFNLTIKLKWDNLKSPRKSWVSVSQHPSRRHKHIYENVTFLLTMFILFQWSLGSISYKAQNEPCFLMSSFGYKKELTTSRGLREVIRLVLVLVWFD